MVFIPVFLIVVVILAIVLAAMAVGVLLGRKPIRGSCGGLGNATGGSSCSVCSNRDKCSESSGDQNGESDRSSQESELLSERVR
jgi:hypothetical protein